mmetsp:Transcript_41801/g.61370  ORF Transcript_41801/g.61370 Transcript_41801/m.61370 type:complete len:286 (+) Transcript_41801:144-1001(+)
MPPVRKNGPYQSQAISSLLLMLAWCFSSPTRVLIHAQTIPSGCQVCATTGNCHHAFQDGPGKYCGHWIGRMNQELLCCCPLNSICDESPFDCRCYFLSPTSSSSFLHGFGTKHILGLFIIALLLYVFYKYYCKSSTTAEETPLSSSSGGNDYYAAVPIAKASPITPAPPGSNTAYNDTHFYTAEPVASGSTQQRQGGGGNVGAAALGGAAGFLAGAVVGSTFERNREEHRESSGGGYDIAGDSGGSGDDGDEKCDILGDSSGNESDYRACDVVDDDGGYDIRGDF